MPSGSALTIAVETQKKGPYFCLWLASRNKGLANENKYHLQVVTSAAQ